MSQSYRLKLSRNSLKIKVATRIPAALEAESPIVLTIDGRTYTFSLDVDALRSSLDPLYAPISILDEPIIVATASATIAVGTAAVAVQRTGPASTALDLPPVADQDIPLRIFDWSTSVTDHAITLTPAGSETIMNLSSWSLYSTASSLAGVTLIPSVALGGWYIAP